MDAIENNVTMVSGDAIAAKLAKCFLTINGNRYNFMNMINLEVNFDKTKTKVPRLGATMVGHKTVGAEGTFSGKAHYNTSILRRALLEYKNTGVDVYFDMQIINNDPVSSAGVQEIDILGCNTDGGVLAKFDADGEYLDEDIKGTFDDFKMPQEFKDLLGLAA